MAGPGIATLTGGGYYPAAAVGRLGVSRVGVSSVEFISRAVGGWNVRMTLGGKRRSKFFADAAYVSRAAALRAAQAYRDELVALRDEQPKPVPRPLAVMRNGIKSYQIRLPKPGGGTTTTEFSARVHGDYNARRLAVDAYHAAVERAKQPPRRGRAKPPNAKDVQHA